MRKALCLKLCCIACALLAMPRLCVAGNIVYEHICYRILSESGRTVEVFGLEGRHALSQHLRIPEKIIHRSRTYTVVSIAPEAFFEQGAPRISSVHLPASVASIGQRAFRDCRALRRITVDAANPAFTSDGRLLLTRDKREAVVCASVLPRGTRIDLPAGVSRIRPYAFAGCNLADIRMPGVTHIGEGAFAESTLAEIRLPATLRCVGDEAFRGAHLNAIALPEGVEVVARGTFAGCGNLQTVVLPASLRTIGEEAFADCIRLKTVDILTGKGSEAGAGLTTIGGAAFAGCTALERIALPDALAEVGRRAFAGCVRLGEISLPAALSRLGEQAFMGCSALASVSIGGERVSIGYQAFRDCAALHSVVLSGRSNIAEDAFSGCSLIREIRCHGRYTLRGRPDIWPDEVLRQAVLYIPAGSRSAYAEADPWRNFWAIREQMPGPADDVTLSGDGEKATASVSRE